MGKTKQDNITRMVKFLSQEGQRIVNNQLAKVDYEHRTKNLKDSYGWGVYVYGSLVAKGYQNPEATEPRKWYGEDIYGNQAIADFLETKYKPHDGIDLVVVAAMPYGEVLQEGGGRVKRKYEVIATARDEVKALSRKFKGSTFGIISHGGY